MKSASRITWIMLVVLGLASLAGCGKKGVLLPPEALVPAAVESLQLRQRGDAFIILWQAPTKEQGGRPLRDLSAFHLYRRDVAPSSPDCAACPESWSLISTLDLEYLKNAWRMGDYYGYLDQGVKSGATAQYRVLAVSRSGGISPPATTLLRKKVTPPPPPKLKVTPSPDTIRLEMTPLPSPDTEPAGFNIYRQRTGDNPSLLPLNSAPHVTGLWEDRRLEQGVTYRYSATALVRSAGELVESEATTPVETTLTKPELH